MSGRCRRPLPHPDTDAQSPAMKRTSWPTSRNLASARSPRSAERPLMNTLAPASASCSATRSPTPPELPVTRAAFPVNSAGPAIGISLPGLVAAGRVAGLGETAPGAGLSGWKRDESSGRHRAADAYRSADRRDAPRPPARSRDQVRRARPVLDARARRRGPNDGRALPSLVPPARGGRRSAVLVLFAEGPNGPDLLFIRRSDGSPSARRPAGLPRRGHRRHGRRTGGRGAAGSGRGSGRRPW